MRLYYGNIYAKSRQLINAGYISLVKGDMLVIHGRNGSGKTLLIKDIQMNPQNVGYKIVLMDQNNALLIPTMDVLHNIAMSDEQERLKKARQLIEFLGCGYLLQRRITKLSGGESRLVNFMRCVLSDADVLLIDEPTNDLDYSFVEKIIVVLKKIKAEKTIIVVSHDDRIDSIATKSCEVKGNRLIYENELTDIKEVLEEEIPNKEYSSLSMGFVEKCFKRNYLCTLIMLLFTLILGLAVISYKEVCIEDVPEMWDCQVNIYGFFSELKLLEDGEYVPAFAVEAMSSVNILEQTKALENIGGFWDKQYGSMSGLDIAFTQDYKVYPVEYYDMTSDKIILVLDYYMQKYYNSSLGEKFIDTSEYFQVPKVLGAGENCVKLEIDKYWACVEELEKENGMLIGAYLIFSDSNDAANFLQSEKMEELGKKDVLVSSQEINECIHQINKSYRLLKGLKTEMISAFCMLIALCTSFCLVAIINKPIVMVLRNYACSLEEVIEGSKKRVINRKVLLAVFLAFAAWNIWLFRKIPFQQTNYIFVLLLMICISFAYALLCKINDAIIRRFYRRTAR